MKKFISLLLALTMMATMVACVGNANESTTVSVESPASTAASNETIAASLLGTQPVEITFWHCASDEAGLLMDKYIADFNSNNEYRITVNPVYQGQASDATTLLRTILSGEDYSELPDIMQLDATGKLSYYNSGKAFTVDQAMAEFPVEGLLDNYLTGALANWQFAGSQLGLPFNTSSSVTYYNMDLLKQAGWEKAPETFDEIIALYEDMQAAGMSEKVFQAVPNTPTLANWIGQLGSYVVNQSNGSDGTASELAMIDNGALETFLTEWKSMYEAGALLNEESSLDSFIAGDVVLTLNSSSNVNSVLTKVDGAFEAGVSPYVRVNESALSGASVSGSCMVMFDSEDALRKEAAWKFLQYLTSAEVQADFAAGTGYVPNHIGSLDIDTYKNLIAEYPQYTVAFDQIANMPSDMRSVTVGPSIDFYYAIQECVSDMLQYDQTVEETVGIMNDTLGGLLEDYIRNNS